MKFKAEIDVMPHKELLDPQGKTVGANVKNIGVNNISNVRIGKHISLELDAENEQAATANVETVCKRLLSNPIMESYNFKIEPC